MVGYHRSVLLNEVLDALEVKKDEWYLDCTLGDGGHTLGILDRGGKVVGIDVDPESLARARQRLKGSFNKRLKLLIGNFRDLKNLLQAEQSKFAGVIFDLGVSSLQLETPERGFSFANQGPLDMRMDPKLQIRALDLINALSRKELDAVFSKLGEEKYSRSLADAAVSARQIKTTIQLASLVEDVYRKKGIKFWRIHPATRIFQALRIAVNDELNALQEGLGGVIELIDREGRIVVMSFHSLEDRIVKNTFRIWEDQGLGKRLTKKPIRPTELEVSNNPRSRSAKMRVFKVSYDNN